MKYFWRDAVSRQNAEGKVKLITRLNSMDTRGLGLPLLRGETLVYYAGSLVGRDFRAVLQVAPSVLYDMIPNEAYEAWLALCRLAPLIFQPVIENRTAYEVSVIERHRLKSQRVTLTCFKKHLNNAVTDFLAATALWTTQWFNKPKFHLFLHLLFYIRRFGPAILYATEGFESYNFLIRLRSVHSNRHAPSADIAEAFSFLHAVRHLVSGGHVLAVTTAGSERMWRQAGDGVRRMVEDKVFRHLMGMDGILDVDAVGKCEECVRDGPILTYNIARLPLLYKDPRVHFSDTETARVGYAHLSTLSSEVLRCEGVYLDNGDVARHKGWVVYSSGTTGDVQIGQVAEILLRAGDGGPLGLLIMKATAGDEESPYRLPCVHLKTDEHEFVALRVSNQNTYPNLRPS